MTLLEINVLVACEESGIVRNAFCREGFNAFSVDILDSSDTTSEFKDRHFKEDALYVMKFFGPWHLIISHPPCTRLTNAGNRWYDIPPKGKTLEQIQQELVEGVAFFKACLEAPAHFVAVENPIMGKKAKDMLGDIGPSQLVQPWYFGEPFFKGTRFWKKNLPDLIPTNILTPPIKSENPEEYNKWSYVHRLGPSKDRAKLRSKTFPGIAEAMAKQWGNHIRNYLKEYKYGL